MEDSKSCDSKSCCVKLSVCNLGMAVGIVWGLSMLFTALLSVFFSYGIPFVELFGSIYIGFEATLIGAFFGLLWGFVAGFFFGALTAFFYNFCRCKCPCSYCKSNRTCCK